MIVLSRHFKTLINIFIKIFDVLSSTFYVVMLITVDHCTLAHSCSIVFYLQSIAIYFNRF